MPFYILYNVVSEINSEQYFLWGLTSNDILTFEFLL